MAANARSPTLRARRSARCAGALVVLAGLLLNRWSLGALLAPDGHIESSTAHTLILAGQALCVLTGVWLVARAPLARAPRFLVVAVTAAVGVTVVAGGYGTAAKAYEVAVRRGWIHPRVLDLHELCEWLPRSGDEVLDASLVDRGAERLARAEAVPDNEAEVIVLRRRVADLAMRHGDVARSVSLLQSAGELAAATGSRDLLQAVRRELGVALLRGGEVDHCIEHHNPERCLFPIRGAGVWTDPAGALRAIASFDDYLAADPADPGARWLLNLAHMAAGSYPTGLDQVLRIPEASAFETGTPLPRFRDVASALGLDTFDPLGGAILDDFDGDGWLDVVTSTFAPCEPLRFFHNEGDGTFADWSTRAKLGAQLGGFNLVQADYDNDGRLDILVLRGAWLGPERGRQRNSLLRQSEDGTFADVTVRAGLADVAYPCQAAAWADYDGDGDLDLYVGNERFPGELFRNVGDGTFDDVAAAAGVDNDGAAGHGYAKGVSWGDYDNDGDPDLYVSNYGQQNRLYRNDGDGTFTDVAEAAGVRDDSRSAEQLHTFTSWFFDFDNDGWLDVFVAGYNGTLGDVVADYLGQRAGGAQLQLFHNNGDGTFADVSESTGIARVCNPMGANYGDVDNDGLLDIYLGTGSPYFEMLVPNRLYHNVGGRRFAEATTSAGVGHLQKGHGVAFGDLDNDGDQDILVQMGGYFPADAFHNALFENPGNDHRWITVRLLGTHANRSAIGARLAVTVSGPSGQRTIHTLAGSGGSFGASSLQQEIGLGDAERLELLEVAWPGSGTRQRFESLPLDRFVEITEGEDHFSVLEHDRIRLDGKR